MLDSKDTVLRGKMSDASDGSTVFFFSAIVHFGWKKDEKGPPQTKLGSLSLTALLFGSSIFETVTVTFLIYIRQRWKQIFESVLAKKLQKRGWLPASRELQRERLIRLQILQEFKGFRLQQF